MCEKLFNDIKTVGTLRGLLMTLADDGQEFIIVNLGFEPNDFQQRERLLKIILLCFKKELYSESQFK